MTKAQQKETVKAIIKNFARTVGEAKVKAEKPDATNEEKAIYMKRLARLDGAVFVASFLEIITAADAIQQKNEGIKEEIEEIMKKQV